MLNIHSNCHIDSEHKLKSFSIGQRQSFDSFYENLLLNNYSKIDLQITILLRNLSSLIFGMTEKENKLFFGLLAVLMSSLNSQEHLNLRYFASVYIIMFDMNMKKMFMFV